MTSLYDAIHRTVTEKFEPLTGRKAIVVLSDGVDTWSRHATYESTLELVSNTGVSSYAIQYETRNDGGSPTTPFTFPPRQGNSLFPRFVQGSPVNIQTWGQSEQSINTDFRTDRQELSTALWQSQAQPKRDRYLIASDYLRALAAQSGALYLRAESIESSSYAFALIANELRHQYTLAYYPSNDKRDGGFRTISVSIKGGDFSVRARQGYRAPKNEKAEEKTQDKNTGVNKAVTDARSPSYCAGAVKLVRLTRSCTSGRDVLMRSSCCLPSRFSG
ncbi:MAG TPA: hypothetical protein VJS64_19990 [Pyrinomonadaceae bacterium]|nr:hypothetical protein [Pyrinomonadaceae bacterium]